MEWYVVLKHIKSCQYLYWQRTYRDGKAVRTENSYIGPFDPNKHAHLIAKRGGAKKSELAAKAAPSQAT